MKRIIGLGLATLTTAVASTAPLLASTGAQAAVAPLETNTINFSGPATATMVMGGQTYKFKNGSCESIKVSDITVDVDLGSVVQGKNGGPVKGNGKKPWFSMDLSSSTTDLLNAVYYGGKELTAGGAITVTGSVVKSGASKATFKTAPGASDLSGKPFSLSGSWNCHGSFAKH
jgi:hypothetical protein